MEHELGVTGLQRIIIRLVGRFPGVTAGRLAELVHVHPSTLTGVLKRLVDHGHIARARDANDGRVSHFVLTPLGVRMDKSQAGTVESLVRKAIARMDAEQLASARAVLAAVARELSIGDR
jgi:DNA-binding MarR family transcriptional regulator